MVNRARQNAHTGLVGLTFFTLFASDAWRNLIGWWGYLALGVALLITWLIIVLRARRSLYWRALPASFVIFLIWAGLSITWSAYPGASALGWGSTLATAFVAYGIVLTTDRAELVRGLGFALRWILAVSLIFEAAVSLFVRHPVLPLWVNWGATKIPDAFYWSQDRLLSLGPIQGIVGNRNLLGFIALLALIIFCVQLADRAVWRGSGIMWIVIAAATLVLTRSSTVIVALVAVAVVAAAALWARSRPASRRWPVYLTVGAGAIVTLATASLWWRPVVALLGRSADATGRTDIWNAVWGLIVERPVVGWGWISYWAPWVEPFDHLAERKGVLYLQAHNAWLDVWMQVGIIGLILFSLVALMALWRSWFLAVDRPRWDLDDHRPFTAHALMPLLLLVALLAQSIAESRILVEGGLALFIAVIVAVKMPARGLGERR
jgi:O-antigen ligase